MAKISEYPLWKSQAISFWESAIDQAIIDENHTGEGFDVQLKGELNDFMSALDPIFNAYANDDTRRGPFIDTLLALSNYATSKFLIVTPEVPVPSLSILPNNSSKDLFAWFNVDLPPFENLFDIVFTEDPLAVPPTVEAELVDISYTDMKNSLSGYLSDDLTKLEQITMQIVGAVRERAAYIVFSGADAVIVRNEGTPKDVLLNQFEVLEVLNEFGWTVKGLNA